MLHCQVSPLATFLIHGNIPHLADIALNAKEAVSWMGRKFMGFYNGSSHLIGKIATKTFNALGVSQETQDSLLVSGSVNLILDSIIPTVIWSMHGDSLNSRIVKMIEPTLEPIAMTALTVATCQGIKYFISECRQNRTTAHVTAIKVGVTATTLYFCHEQLVAMSANTINEALLWAGQCAGPTALALACRGLRSPAIPIIWGHNGFIQSYSRSVGSTLILGGMLATPSYSFIGLIWGGCRTITLSAIGLIAYDANKLIPAIQKLKSKKGPVGSTILFPLFIKLINNRWGNPDLFSLFYKSMHQQQHPSASDHIEELNAANPRSIIHFFINTTLPVIFQMINVKITDILGYQLKLLHMYLSLMQNDNNINQSHAKFVRAFFEHISTQTTESHLELNRCKSTLIRSIEERIKQHAASMYSGPIDWSFRTALELTPKLYSKVNEVIKGLEKAVVGNLFDFSKMKSFNGQRDKYIEQLLEIYLTPYLSLILMLKAKNLPDMVLETDPDFSIDFEPEMYREKIENELLYGMFNLFWTLYINPIKRNIFADNMKRASQFAIRSFIEIKRSIITLFVQPKSNTRLISQILILENYGGKGSTKRISLETEVVKELNPKTHTEEEFIFVSEHFEAPKLPKHKRNHSSPCKLSIDYTNHRLLTNTAKVSHASAVEKETRENASKQQHDIENDCEMKEEKQIITEENCQDDFFHVSTILKTGRLQDLLSYSSVSRSFLLNSENLLQTSPEFQRFAVSPIEPEPDNPKNIQNILDHIKFESDSEIFSGSDLESGPKEEDSFEVTDVLENELDQSIIIQASNDANQASHRSIGFELGESLDESVILEEFTQNTHVPSVTILDYIPGKNSDKTTRTIMTGVIQSNPSDMLRQSEPDESQLMQFDSSAAGDMKHIDLQHYSELRARGINISRG